MAWKNILVTAFWELYFPSKEQSIIQENIFAKKKIEYVS